MNLPVPLVALIDAQDGLLHRRQATEAGLSRAGVRWRLERGLWRAVLPLVFATFAGTLSTRQRHRAALLFAGPQAQITGPAALRVHGLRRVPVDPLVRVLVPHGRQALAAGWVRPLRTRRLDPAPLIVDALVFASLPRAVLDAARACGSQPPVRALMTEAVQDHHCTVDQLRVELAEGPRQHTAIARRVINSLRVGALPAPEVEAEELLAGSDILPRVLWNPLLRTAEGDRLPSPIGWIPEVDLGVDINSGIHDGPVDSVEWALRRDTQLARHGAAVLHFTTAQLRTDPATVRRAVERAYLERLRRGVRGTLAAVATSRS